MLFAELVLICSKYGADVPKIILLDIIEKALKVAVVQSVSGIGSASLAIEGLESDPQTKVRVVYTEGVNVTAMRDYQEVINPNKIFTNDIAVMLKHYGVEACRNSIIREMQAVFTGHNIDVDRRHLQLIADTMTQGGGFVPFNRYGMARSTSPLMKMSFETTVGYLRDACLDGDFDKLQSPSARLVVGGLSGVGTGSFDVLVDPTAMFD